MSLAFHIQIGPSHLLSRVRRLPWILFAWSAAVVVFDRVDSMAFAPWKAPWVALAVVCLAVMVTFSIWAWPVRSRRFLGGQRGFCASLIARGLRQGRVRSSAMRTLAEGACLDVDASGQGALRCHASELPRLVTVSGVLRLPWLTVLMMIPRSRDEASDAGWRVFVGRDAVNDDAWCALRRWLRWLERGSHGC